MIDCRDALSEQIVESLRVFETLTPGDHILRSGRVNQLAPPRARIHLSSSRRRPLRGTLLEKLYESLPSSF
eukprot:4252594-Pyramimonas_sp.AAC.1